MLTYVRSSSVSWEGDGALVLVLVLVLGHERGEERAVQRSAASVRALGCRELVRRLSHPRHRFLTLRNFYARFISRMEVLRMCLRKAVQVDGACGEDLVLYTMVQ
jgi:hypothetical protein